MHSETCQLGTVKRAQDTRAMRNRGADCLGAMKPLASSRRRATIAG